MAWKLYYYDEVAVDVADAKKWYRKQQKYLDKRFAEDVKISLDRLQKNPPNYEIKYRNVRNAYCDIFPYAVHFYADELIKRIEIIAIVHQHRDPEYPSNR